MAPFTSVVEELVKLKSLLCKHSSDFEASIEIVGMIDHKMKLVIAVGCHDCIMSYAINQ